ncbi:hypothetical protein BGX34_007808 [Mortierella sp. NVP85]|nr:hypothetical protein BGX34_007808 [Mortierella sp. NVP85]
MRKTDDDNQALDVSPHSLLLKMALRLPPTLINPFRPGTENSMAQPEEPHMFQLQMDKLVQRIQQTDQKMEEVLERTQQQMQDRIMQTLQQMSRQHTEEANRLTQQLNLQRHQWEEALRISQQNQHQQFEAVQQRLEQLDQDSRQQVQHMQQHMQQQIDKAQNDAHHSQQQYEQLLQQVYEMGNARQDHLSPELGLQASQLVFHQFVHVRYCIQAVLTQPSPKLPTPRLFIILPAQRLIVDGQEESSSIQFRLHFLCECGSYTMDKDCDKPHDVHMANHPGYDLINQDEFINKYGSYLLTMMYMAKYGARTRKLAVPPLLGLTHVIGEHQNISQIVDDTIIRLKEATGYRDGDSTGHKSLDATELTKLQSHLKVTDGECFTGGLSQRCIQKGHYAWICSDHWRESYELALQQLKYNIIANGGVWKTSEAKINVTSEAMARRFYHDLGKLFRIQSEKNWRSWTEAVLEQGGHSHQSASGPTTNILEDPDDLESLFLDFGRFTMSAKGISEVKVKDVAVSIRDLSTLSFDDMEFIQQCRPTALVISGTPQKKDDRRLVGLLQNNVITLRIDCDMKRFIGVIDLVCSTREKMLQSVTQPALRMFELVHPEIKLEVSFDEGSPALDMPPCINLEDCQSYTVEPAVYNFIRQHGWSDITFVVSESFSNRLAQLLNESMKEIGSRVARLDITPTSLTAPGLDAMSRVINQSQGLTYLRLSLGNLHLNHQLEKALLLLERHKDRLTSLRLEGLHVHQWLPRIIERFPNNDGFPALEEFFLGGLWTHWISDIECRWIASMVSTRSQPRIPLKAFGVADIRFFGQDWTPVILAIDLSTIEELYFRNLALDHEMKLLIHRIMDGNVSSLPLRLLDFKGTTPNDHTAREMFARIREKAPQAEIRWE